MEIETISEKMSDDLIQEACQILTTYKFCRTQAKRLQSCRKKRADEHTGIFSGFSNKNACEREESSYKTCAKEHLESVVSNIVQVSQKFCKTEMMLYQQCKAKTMSEDKCQMLDQKLMECGARKIIIAATTKS
jgi:hypothetical protein